MNVTRHSRHWRPGRAAGLRAGRRQAGKVDRRAGAVLKVDFQVGQGIVEANAGAVVQHRSGRSLNSDRIDEPVAWLAGGVDAGQAQRGGGRAAVDFADFEIAGRLTRVVGQLKRVAVGRGGDVDRVLLLMSLRTSLMVRAWLRSIIAEAPLRSVM